MKKADRSTNPRYHVGLGLILDQYTDNRFSFDRSASLADLWAICFYNLIRHPLKATIFARRYMHGVWAPPKEYGPSMKAALPKEQ